MYRRKAALSENIAGMATRIRWQATKWRRWVSLVWRRYWFYLVCQFVAACIAIFWIPYANLPAPGYAIAIIAVVAALMSVHPDLRHWQKFFYLLLLGAFLVTELRAIRKDRKDSIDAAIVEQKKLNEIRSGQDRQLEATATNISQTATGFQAMLNQAKATFGEAEKAADLAKDGVQELTGADSYMVIYPHGRLLGGQPVDGTFDLLNVVEGKHPIWDGRIFMKEGSISDPNNLYKAAQEFDLKPVIPTNLAGFGKSIQPPKIGISSYNFSVSSRGPLTDEGLDVQFNAKANRWEYKLEIWEPQPFTKTPLPSIRLKQVDWTPIPYPRIVQMK